MTFAGLTMALAGGESMFSYLRFFIPAAMLLGFLANKGKLRFLALIFLVPVLFPGFSGRLQFALTAPALAYIVYYANKLPYDIKIINYPGVFKFYTALNLVAAFVLFTWIPVWAWAISAVTIPYVIMFSVSAVIMMHMVRHEREVLSHTKFKAMSILSVTGVFLMGFILSSEWLIEAVLGFMGDVQILIFGALALFLVLFVLIGFVKYDFSRLKGQLPKILGALVLIAIVLLPLFLILEEGGEIQEFGAAVLDIEQGLNIWLLILLGFISLILLLMAAALIRLLYEFVLMLYNFLTEKQPKNEPSPEFERLILEGDEIGIRKKEKGKVSNPIRRIYRKFLKLCKVRGVVIEKSQTTADIAVSFGNAVGEHEGAFALRDIYAESRYGEKEPKIEDIKECRELYNKLKKQLPNR